MGFYGGVAGTMDARKLATNTHIRRVAVMNYGRHAVR